MSLDEIMQYSVAQEISLWVDMLERKKWLINSQQKDVIQFITVFFNNYMKDFTYVVSQSVFSEIWKINDDNLDGNISGILLQLKWLFQKRELRKDMPQNWKPPFVVHGQTIFQTREKLKADEDAFIKELLWLDIIPRFESLIWETDNVAVTVAKIL